MVLLRLVPVNDQAVTKGQRSTSVHSARFDLASTFRREMAVFNKSLPFIEVEQRACERGFDVTDGFGLPMSAENNLPRCHCIKYTSNSSFVVKP